MKDAIAWRLDEPTAVNLPFHLNNCLPEQTDAPDVQPPGCGLSAVLQWPALAGGPGGRVERVGQGGAHHEAREVPKDSGGWGIICHDSHEC